jgi:hypothetical protein
MLAKYERWSKGKEGSREVPSPGRVWLPTEILFQLLTSSIVAFLQTFPHIFYSWINFEFERPRGPLFQPTPHYMRIERKGYYYLALFFRG